MYIGENFSDQFFYETAFITLFYSEQNKYFDPKLFLTVCLRSALCILENDLSKTTFTACGNDSTQ